MIEKLLEDFEKATYVERSPYISLWTEEEKQEHLRKLKKYWVENNKGLSIPMYSEDGFEGEIER
jgi:hypothetical protein